MLIYSKKIIKFIHHIKIHLQNILSQEIGLKVFKDHFYDRREYHCYPIKVVIFNDQKILGYFDPHFYEIGFHECLMHASREKLQKIIRHELAHYITYINYGESVEPHGAEFKAFCQCMGWSTEVQRATTCLDDDFFFPDTQETSLLRKVQKLMALAASSNKNEAEQALIKSQQLLLKHNIDIKSTGLVDEEEEKFFLKRIMKQKKKNAKMCSIARILQTFFVITVYNRQENFTYLEIVGNPSNVEIATYVANTLDHHLDILWNQTKKRQPNLKGVVAKNSFLLGVAQGYCNKIQCLKKEYTHANSNALSIIEKKLEEVKTMVYPRLKTSYSQTRYCSDSSKLGEQAGKRLNINPALKNHSKNSNALLTFQQ